MDTVIKKEAISYHYDVGNDFYSHWLDSRMVYSCALWLEDDSTSLEEAQLDKLDWHLSNLNLESPANILDIGCGWGSLLVRHCEKHPANNGVGLTLSEEQFHYIQANKNQFQIMVQNWIDHQPQQPYDGIISIGAFEHFANRSLSSTKKIGLYKRFFANCQEWLITGGMLSLQSIVYDEMKAEDQNLFISDQVFPNSELPLVEEIVEASADYFTLENLRLDGLQYGKTCDLWLAALRSDKKSVISLFGKETYDHYVKYLKYCVIGFYSKKISLSRFVFKSRN